MRRAPGATPEAPCRPLADLEALVEELEGGDLPLDKAMKKFEEGIKLTRS